MVLLLSRGANINAKSEVSGMTSLRTHASFTFMYVSLFSEQQRCILLCLGSEPYRSRGRARGVQPDVTVNLFVYFKFFVVV